MKIMNGLRQRIAMTAAAVILFITALMWVFPSQPASGANTGSVYVIPVKQPIERGLTSFMERGFKEAEKMKAGLIILEIDTPGGLVDQAGKSPS